MYFCTKVFMYIIQTRINHYHQLHLLFPTLTAPSSYLENLSNNFLERPARTCVCRPLDLLLSYRKVTFQSFQCKTCKSPWLLWTGMERHSKHNALSICTLLFKGQEILTTNSRVVSRQVCYKLQRKQFGLDVGCLGSFKIFQVIKFR